MNPEIRNKRIDIGGRCLSINCLGQGSPAVIFEAGFEGTSAYFDELLPAIAAFTRAVSYDRAGLGKSDPADCFPRTCQDIVDDLHDLLTNAQIDPPYVLVGQSWSGYIVRLFASLYPQEVAGMVLIDCAYEDRCYHQEKYLTADLVDRLWAWEKDPFRNEEKIDRMASYAQLQVARRQFDFPLIVLTRGIPGTDPSGVWPDIIYQVDVDRQQELLKLSTQSKQVIAERSGHVIQEYQPELIIQAIGEVVETYRNPFHHGGP